MNAPNQSSPMAGRSRAERFGTVAPSPGRLAARSPEQSLSPAAAAAPAPLVQLESFVGVLERVRVINSEWAIGTAYSDERKAVTLVGSGLKDLVEGNEYTFSGTTKNHPKFGLQFDVVSGMPYVRPDRNSIVKYIVKNFKGVGPTTAEKFITSRLESAQDKGVALEEVRQQLLNAPWTLDFSAVTKKAKFKANEEDSPVAAYVHRDLATRLGGMPGVKDSVLKALAQYLLQSLPGDKAKAALDPHVIQKCWASLVQDPYEPTRSVPGYGFTTADAIGASVNIPRDAPVRIKALVAHALDLACQRAGHVYLNHGELVDALKRLDPRVPAQESIELGLAAEMIALDDEMGPRRYYTPRLLEAETELAKNLAKLIAQANPLSKMTPEQAARKIQEAAKVVAPAIKEGLDSSQVQALAGILTSNTRLHTLTAGPGCGKTQLMEVLSKVLEHKDMVFCGPTGKSAKVLSIRLYAQGREARTIQSTLMGSGRGSFRFNASNPLEGDVLVVDESSMNDVELAESITAAANDGMHVILLGDVDQLPSIAPGSFLRDVLRIKQADHHRLTKTHRNSGGILDVIEQVRSGKVDCMDRPGVSFSHGLDDATTGFAAIAQKYISAAGKYGLEHVALIMSLRAGEADTPGWNTTYANQVLRDLCNPHAVKIPGTRLFVGDRVLIKDNMNVPIAGGAEEAPSERVVNGDTGSITSFEKGDGSAGVTKTIRIKLDDGRLVDFPGAESGLLQHAYAITVHSAQGSEYKKVIAVVTPGHSSFMNQAMLFTGLSRAREGLDINAQDTVLRKIAATPLPKRNSALVERVQALLGESADENEDDVDTDPVDDVEVSHFVQPEPVPEQQMTLRQRYSQRYGT